MSAFGFITNSSPLLSPSLVEDLYDSRQLNTFVNQSTSTLKHGSNSIKNNTKSFFSFIDELDSTTSVQPKKSSIASNDSLSDHVKESKLLPLNNSSPDLLEKSAFEFIGQSAATPTKRAIPANSEMKLISATTSLQRLESEKTKQMNKVQRFYKKELQIYEQLSTLKSKIDLVQEQKEQALSKEDFLLAETLQIQEEKMSQSLYELEQAPSLLRKQIFTCWQHLHSLQEQESQLAKQVTECCQKVREERYTQYSKFVSDSEKIYEEKLKEIHIQGEMIETEKSERAFELGLWEQADEDLVSREDDAIHEELGKKKDIETKAELIQIEIKELNEKLKLLETQKSELLANAIEVDLSIQEKLKPFANERLEHEQEFETIEIKRRDLEEKANNLHAFEEQLDLERSRHFEEKERGLKEIQSLDEQISLSIEKSNNDDSTLDLILEKIKDRDEIIEQYQTEMKKYKESLIEKKKSVDMLNHTLYDQQQKNIHLDETILEMQQKLKSLERHKQLSIETRRFQNAASWTNQIKLLEKEVTKLVIDQNQQKQIDLKLESQLNVEKDDLNLLENQYLELKNKKYAEIKLILEKFRDELQEITCKDTIINLELEMINEMMKNDY